MKICITNARGRLTRLIQDAAAGDDVVLTHNGVAVARLVAIKTRPSGGDSPSSDGALTAAVRKDRE